MFCSSRDILPSVQIISNLYTTDKLKLQRNLQNKQTDKVSFACRKSVSFTLSTTKTPIRTACSVLKTDKCFLSVLVTNVAKRLKATCSTRRFWSRALWLNATSGGSQVEQARLFCFRCCPQQTDAMDKLSTRQLRVPSFHAVMARTTRCLSTKDRDTRFSFCLSYQTLSLHRAFFRITSSVGKP